MLIIKHEADLVHVLGLPIDADLKNILALRSEQLLNGCDEELAGLALFVVVQPGDALNAIEAELGFPVAVNLVDGMAFGSPDFVPSWELIERHSGWFEVAFVLTDDGFGHVLLIPDIEGVDATLLALCRTYCQQAA